MLDDLAHARGWFRKAESDLTAARRVLEGDGPYDTACFHAQQAAERFLKGFLAFKARPVPRVHNIEDLQHLCCEADPGLNFALLAGTQLTPYAVELRYEFDFWPERETAAEAIVTAEALRAVVLERVAPEARP